MVDPERHMQQIKSSISTKSQADIKTLWDIQLISDGCATSSQSQGEAYSSLY